MPPAAQRRLQRLPDGTVKQRSGVTGTVVWTVPGRSNRPLPRLLPPGSPLADDPAARPRCAFCPGHELETPPERTRLLLPRAAAPGEGGDGGEAGWVVRRDLLAPEVLAEPWDIRRFGNLFPILPFDYWRANHGMALTPQERSRAQRYAADPEGRAHLLAIMRTQLRAAGTPDDRVVAEPDDRLLGAAATLFASTHDLVVARRHHVEGARLDDELAGSGDLTPEEHHAFLALTVEGLADLLGRVPGARSVAVFQNWLRPAGASFDHLHKQLVAVDELGPLLERVLDRLVEEPELFNTEVADPAARDGLVIAENAHAIALAGVGHRYPTIECYATGPARRPHEATPAELRGMADLLHACHAATGPGIPTNEEWHVQPPGLAVPMPWRIHLKWRLSTLAGFEGGTKINVNTTSPFDLRERMVSALQRLRDEGRIAPLAIGDECDHRLGALRYTR
jgi:galactose-1-phosphate uridylyltransferase